MQEVAVPDRGKPMFNAARAARRALLLDQAAGEFRRIGVAGADLAQIARNVGLTRSSLYNYCADRHDLASQCYFHLLEPLLAELDRSMATADSGLAAVLEFLVRTRERDQSHAIIAAELDTLGDAGRNEVTQAQNRAFAKLERVIARGIADHSIRPCDPAIAARTIWGLLAWAPLGDIWARRAAGDQPGRVSIEVARIVEIGVATTPAPARIEDTPGEEWHTLAPPHPANRGEEIIATASALFNARGVEGVSLDDVAAAMSATKGMIYHHFESKAALLTRCLERAFDLYDRLLDRADRHGSAAERSRAGIVLNVEAQLDSAGPMSLTAAAYRMVGERERDRFSRQANALLDRSIATMKRGKADGTLRPFDAATTALASAGTFNFIARWLPADRALSPREVAFEVANLFLHGLGTPAARRGARR